MNNTTNNILSAVFGSRSLNEGLKLPGENNRALDHLDYINRQMTHSKLPVRAEEGNWSTFDYGEYQALTKEYNFASHDHMMYFINEVLRQSDRINHHPKLVIDHNKVSVDLYTKDINDITEADTELSRSIDEIFEDISYIDTL
tara:strand:+ start:118 stop:546 length:429 start_codon:yes stop_codon:yes gene_type:complete